MPGVHIQDIVERLLRLDQSRDYHSLPFFLMRTKVADKGDLNYIKSDFIALCMIVKGMEVILDPANEGE